MAWKGNKQKGKKQYGKRNNYRKKKGMRETERWSRYAQTKFRVQELNDESGKVVRVR
jgi:hypothetical protein